MSIETKFGKENHQPAYDIEDGMDYLKENE